MQALHHAPYQSQPKAPPGEQLTAVQPHERAEHPLTLLRVEAHPVVLNAEEVMPGCRVHAHMNPGLRAERGELDRIGEQLQEDHVQALAVPLHRRQRVVRQGELTVPRLGFQLLKHPVQQVVQVQGLRRATRQAALKELGERGRERPHLRGRHQQVFQVPGARLVQSVVGRVQTASQQPGKAFNLPHGPGQVMGHGAQNTLEFSVQQLVFSGPVFGFALCALQFADVGHDHPGQQSLWPRQSGAFEPRVPAAAILADHLYLGPVVLGRAVLGSGLPQLRPGCLEGLTQQFAEPVPLAGIDEQREMPPQKLRTVRSQLLAAHLVNLRDQASLVADDVAHGSKLEEIGVAVVRQLDFQVDLTQLLVLLLQFGLLNVQLLLLLGKPFFKVFI